MSNSYNTATGTLTFAGPPVVTPLVAALVGRYALESPNGFTEGAKLPAEPGAWAMEIYTNEDTRVDWDYGEVLEEIEALCEALGINGTLPAEPEKRTAKVMLRAIGAFYGTDLDLVLQSFDESDSVDLGTLVRICHEVRDGNNVSGVWMRGGYWCDKTRPDEFGGWVQCVSERVDAAIGTPALAEWFEKLDRALADDKSGTEAAKVIATIAGELIQCVRDDKQAAAIVGKLVGRAAIQVTGETTEAPADLASDRAKSGELLTLIARAQGSAAAQEELDEMVADACDNKRSTVTNEGPEGQVLFLIDEGFTLDEIETRLFGFQDGEQK